MTEMSLKVKSETTLSDLPDDCIREIFLHLSLLQRINMRQVCRRWRQISDDCWSEVKSVCLSSKDKTDATGDGKNIVLCTSNQILATECIRHCAPYVKKFKDTRWQGDKYYSTPEDIELLRDIGGHRYFSALPALELSTKMEDLRLRQETPLDDFYINTVFGGNKKIKRLWIDMNERSRCLENLPTEHLKRLEIHVRNLDHDPYDLRLLKTLKEKLLNCPQLEELTIHPVDDELLHVIGKVQSLRTLKIKHSVRHSTTSNGLISITQLHNLRVLKIVDCTKSLINYEFLANLSKNCANLQQLYLSPFGDRITDDGLLVLSHLQHLKNLYIDTAYRISGKCLSCFGKIERLTVITSKITDDFIIALLRSSSTLKYLYLCGCDVTSDTVKVAIGEVEKRTNGVALELILEKAKVKFSEVISPPFYPI